MFVNPIHVGSTLIFIYLPYPSQDGLRQHNHCKQQHFPEQKDALQPSESSLHQARNFECAEAPIDENM